MAGLPEEEISIIEQVDANYVEEVSRLPLADAGAFRHSDHIATREWLRNVYAKLPHEVPTKRVRPRVDVTITDTSVQYGEGDMFSVRIYDPQADEDSALRPALLMFHGGGWIHGFPAMDEEFAKFIASEVRVVVAGVDYRLAPEYPYPTPRNDAYEALNWVIRNAKSYRVDINRIALWGISSGANLAASICLRDSEDHQTSRIKHASLVVPATCDPDYVPPILDGKAGSMTRYPLGGNEDKSNVALKRIWNMYAGSNSSEPAVSVLLATPKSNHPPVHITVAGLDSLRDQGIAYYLKLRNTGIDSQLELVPGLPHGINLSPKTFAANQYFRNQARILNCALHSEF